MSVTCDAKPILESILLHGKHPSNDASNRGQRKQRVPDGLRNGADGCVGAPMVHYHVGVEVGVLKDNGNLAVPHKDLPFHLAVIKKYYTLYNSNQLSQEPLLIHQG